MFRRLPRPLLAIAVIPLVVIVGLQSAWAAFACSVDGQVRDHCCCKRTDDARREVRDRDAAPRVAPPGCCEVSFFATDSAPTARDAERVAFADMPVAVPVASLDRLSPPEQRVHTIAMLARPPPPRIPLYLAHQTILR